MKKNLFKNQINDNVYSKYFNTKILLMLHDIKKKWRRMGGLAKITMVRYE